MKPFITVRLDATLKRLVDRIARRERQSTSEWIRQTIIHTLRDNGEVIPDPSEKEERGQ